jgi:hypothetical protein
MSPDLELRILVPHLNFDRADRIAGATHVEGAVRVESGPRRFLFLPQRPRLFSWQVHDLLAESADWNADTWDMEAAELHRLVRTFEILFDQIQEQFAVEVMWAGDVPAEEHDVSREELLDIVRRGRLGTKVRYRVQAG